MRSQTLAPKAETLPQKAQEPLGSLRVGCSPVVQSKWFFAQVFGGPRSSKSGKYRVQGLGFRGLGGVGVYGV